METTLLKSLLESTGTYAFPLICMITILYFYNKQSLEREKRLVARLDNIEDFQRNELTELTKTTLLSLDDAANAIKNNDETIRTIVQVLKQKPCLK